MPYAMPSCGCAADLATLRIRYCPLHAAAPEMRLALVDADEWLRARHGQPENIPTEELTEPHRIILSIGALLARIEGK
jgi:hypothetical protein